MLKNSFVHTVVEIILIVVISAAFGVVWNRTLLADAWRGEPTQQATAPKDEALPMPVGLAQVKEMHDANQAVLIDARSAASFAREHIAGAISLPLEAVGRHQPSPLLKNTPNDATLIVYCNGFSCHDSMELGKLLIKGGYGSVYVFEGGLPEWRDAGYPTAKGER